MTQTLTYEDWMEEVDNVVMQLMEIGVHDLPDFPSRDMYDAGESPIDAAQTAINNA